MTKCYDIDVSSDPRISTEANILAHKIIAQILQKEEGLSREEFERAKHITEAYYNALNRIRDDLGRTPDSRLIYYKNELRATILVTPSVYVKVRWEGMAAHEPKQS